jgi:hypothetical protein
VVTNPPDKKDEKMENKMTALEMAGQMDWAELTVTFPWGGHVTQEGRVNVVPQSFGYRSAVWVGNICLPADAVVKVDGDKATAYHHDNVQVLA